MYHGDFALGSTLDIKFTTRQFSTGAPFALAGTPAVAAYPDNSTTEITAGITLSNNFDSRTGLHNVRVVASSGNGYAAGSTYTLVLTSGTVDGVSVVGEVVGVFSIEARSALRPTTAGRTLTVESDGVAHADVKEIAAAAVSASTAQLGVNVVNAGGTAWGSGAITAGAIASNAITDAKIATGAITAEKIAADAITGDKIAPGAIAKGDQLTGLNDLSAADVNAEVDTALADYDPPTHTELTARTLASADYATASALTTVDTEIGVIDGIVDSLLARSVPLTVTTCVVVDDAANTASTFETNLAETDDDHWNGAFLLAASGDLAGQVRRVTDYDGTTKFITVDGGFTAEPAAAVSMVLVNR